LFSGEILKMKKGMTRASDYQAVTVKVEPVLPIQTVEALDIN
jgi:hypothetical protein